MQLTKQIFDRHLHALYRHYQRDPSKYNFSGIRNILSSANITSEDRLERICTLLRYKVTGEVPYKASFIVRQPLGSDWEQAIKDLIRHRWDVNHLIVTEPNEYSIPYGTSN